MGDERKRKKKEEEGWTEEEKEQRLKDIKKMKFIKRYIDDGLTVNGIDILMKYIEEIYPGMIVKKENEKNHKTHFLDLNMVKVDRQLVLSTYDKRDAFPFEVRGFPDLSGNVP